MLPAQVSYWTLEEGKRHNANVEQENYRHNVAMEQYNRDELARKREEMEANIRLKEREIEEQHRANVAREMYNAQMAQNNFLSISEAARHNVQSEYETAQHNRAVEDINAQNVNLGFVNAGISSRNTDIRSTQIDHDYEIAKQKVAQGWFGTSGNLFKTAVDVAGTFVRLLG